ncbi:rhomboid protease AarA [Providencia rustigianii]
MSEPTDSVPTIPTSPHKFSLWAITLTLLIVTLNIAIYFYQLNFAAPLESQEYNLLLFGANVYQLSLTGDWWRYPISMVLHSGWVHLGLNTLALLVIGIECERAFGKFRYLAIYLFAGIVGAFVSAAWQYQEALNSVMRRFDMMSWGSLLQNDNTVYITVSLGASGAIMGLAAASVIELLKRLSKPELTKEARDALKRPLYNIIAMIALTLINGLQSGVDNAAHIGGAVAGAVIGFTFVLIPVKKYLLDFILTVIIGGVLALVIHQQSFSTDEDLVAEREFIYQELDKELNSAKADQAKLVMEKAAEEELASLPTAQSEEQIAGIRVQAPEFIEPRFILSDDTHQRIFITDEEANLVSAYSSADGNWKLLFTIKLALPKNDNGCSSNRCRGMGASGAALSADGKKLYVASLYPNSVSIIDIDTQKVETNIETSFFPRQIYVMKNSQRAFVTSGVENSIVVINLTNNTVEKKLTFPNSEEYQGAFGVQMPAALSPDEKQLALYDNVTQAAYLLDTQTMAFSEKPWFTVEDYQNAVREFYFTPDGQSIWMVTDSRFVLANIDTPTNPVTAYHWCGNNSEIQYGQYGINTGLNQAYYLPQYPSEAQVPLVTTSLKTLNIQNVLPIPTNGEYIQGLAETKNAWVVTYPKSFYVVDKHKSVDRNSISPLLCFGAMPSE